MASYRNISMDFWTDSKVVDDFTPEDRYIYLYCMTNPHTNLCGCYEVSIKQIANETGYNNDSVERLLKRLDGAHNVIRYSAQTKELLILNWCRYNWSASEKLNKPLLSEIRRVKNDRFREYLAARYNERGTVRINCSGKVRLILEPPETVCPVFWMKRRSSIILVLAPARFLETALQSGIR